MNRTRNEDGYLTVQALAIIVLITASLLVVIQSAASRVDVASQSRALTDAHRASDRAGAYLFNRFNSTVADAPFGADGTTAQGTTGDGEPTPSLPGGGGDQSTSRWSSDPVKKTVTVTTENDSSARVREIAVRGHQFVDTTTRDDGEGPVTVYQVPAGPRQATTPDTVPGRVYGLWGNAVSTWKNVSAFGSTWGSWVNGSVRDADGTPGKGTWGVYGGTVNEWTGTSKTRYVKYNDTAVVPNNARTSRSEMTAEFDRSVTDVLRNQVRRNDIDCVGNRSITQFHLPGAGNYQCHRTSSGNPAVLSNALAGNLTAGGSGPVRTVVIRGDLVIKNSINVSSSQVHFYVTGDVRFETPSNVAGSVLTLNNVFIYTPTGQCSTAEGIQVQLTGSLACARVTLGTGAINPPAASSNNIVRWTEPWPTQVRAVPYTNLVLPGAGAVSNTPVPKHVFIFERSGFADQWTP